MKLNSVVAVKTAKKQEGKVPMTEIEGGMQLKVVAIKPDHVVLESEDGIFVAANGENGRVWGVQEVDSRDGQFNGQNEFYICEFIVKEESMEPEKEEVVEKPQDPLALLLAEIKKLNERIDKLEKPAAVAPKPKIVKSVEEIPEDGLMRVTSPDEAGLIKVHSESRRGQPNPHRRYEIIGVPAQKAIALQAIKCMIVLARCAEVNGVEVQGHKGKILTEAQAKAALEAKQDKISFNQTAWHVFTYYRAELEERGYLIQYDHYDL